ncbi:aminotransferase-like domain-containing protein [Dongia rigui]|uniref:PLP-dependent aminotransferase family protein n=1 Tax=Dongia rigui TaxID=940149 RepID=A0ABU5E2U0_9PROT|nr:PLP-dependent aminotransferase family protein [Dongia rigui]MDY0873917.1 PLP-dependent aminotransferase family protein [Dongia rigui]
MDLDLTLESGSLTQRIAGALGKRMANGALGAGERLPSVRRLAGRLGVSPFTVVAAYDRLVADGLVVARAKSGFFVAGRTQTPPLSLDPLPSAKMGVNPIWMMRRSLTLDPKQPKPGCGWLPQDWLPDAALRSALRALSRAPEAGLLEYGVPLGFRPLRDLLARRLNEIEVPAVPEHILLMDGASQAIDLVCRYLIQPDDAVLVDDPGYFNFHAAVRAQRGRLLPVPMTPQGPDLAAMEQLAKTHQPKLYLTNAGLQNPTGAKISLAVAHRLLALAQRYDFRILEDDIFRDFESQPSPRLAALDGLQRVIHMASFSKTLSAATRIGYLAADPATIADLADLKLAMSFGNNELSAQLVHHLLIDGSYRKHVAAIRDRLAKVRFQVARKLASLGFSPWLGAGADTGEGLFLWLALPPDKKGRQRLAVETALAAQEAGIVLAPGNVFSAEAVWPHHLRFNVAQSQDSRTFAFLKSYLS